MRRILRLECMALLLLATGAEAASWHAVATNGTMRIEMDTASLVKTGRVATAWDKEVYFLPEQAQPGDFYFKSVKTLRRYGCADHVVEPLVQVYYADDGSEIKTVVPGGDGQASYVVPGSVEELKFDYACGDRHAVAKKSRTKPSKTARAKPDEKPTPKKQEVPPSKTGGPAKVQSPAAKQAVAAKEVAQAAPAASAKPAPASQPVPGRASTPIRNSAEPVTALETLTKSQSPIKKP